MSQTRGEFFERVFEQSRFPAGRDGGESKAHGGLRRCWDTPELIHEIPKVGEVSQTHFVSSPNVSARPPLTAGRHIQVFGALFGCACAVFDRGMCDICANHSYRAESIYSAPIFTSESFPGGSSK